MASGWPVRFGGRRYWFDPDKYFAADAPPERSLPSDDDLMRQLLQVVTGAVGDDPGVSDDDG
jgi:hypothetical protein